MIMKNIMMKIGEVILNFFVFIALLLLILSIYYVFQTKIMKKGYANLFGYTMFEVATGSMTGSIEIGDIVIVKLTKEISENDIIVYEKQSQYITHRVIDINGNTILAKGDANNTEDEPILIDQVLGKVVKVINNVDTLKKVITSPAVIISSSITIILFGILIFIKQTPKKDNENKQKYST